MNLERSSCSSKHCASTNRAPVFGNARCTRVANSRQISRKSRHFRRFPVHPVRAAHKGTEASRAVEGLSLPTTLTSLKEWAVTVSALADGEQTILVRKGGIREPTFQPKASAFLLFPTSFHANVDLVRAEMASKYKEVFQFDPRKVQELELGVLACMTGAWTTTDPHILSALEDMHIWTNEYLEGRLRWKKSQPITLMELRCYRVEPPFKLELKEEHFGCFSWVEVPMELDWKDRAVTPAVDEDSFKRSQMHLRERLQRVEATPLERFNE